MVQDAGDVFQPLQADDPREIGGYRLAARLGTGGMGRVYLSHTRGGRPVAIKVVRPELADDPDFRRRFSREIKAARRVRGAYTAELIDADGDGTPPWLATLYVAGPSLTAAVARRGPLPVPTVLRLMAGVAEALQVIHAAGIVHRDLKPANVLLAADGPRVIDFGISLTSDATALTMTGAAIGTPQYMAPEQASDGEITPATDVFSLGQTAAFAALGRSLYADGPSATVLYRIVHSKPDLSALPEELRPLIARCLAAAPADRATPAQIVEWCRQRLGAGTVEEGHGGDAGDAGDAEAWPALWREVRGPEATVPAPVPPPTPEPTAGYTSPLLPLPQPPLPPQPYQLGHPPPQPPRPADRRTRRRRALLITAASTVGAVLLATAVWTVSDGADKLHRAAARHDRKATSSASAPATGTGDPAPAPAASRSPQPEGYPQEWWDEHNSVSLDEPVHHKDRKGDLRMVCGQDGCSLESDHSDIAIQDLKPGGTLDACRIVLEGEHSHRLPLAAVASGNQICVRGPSGELALLVVQVKSTALPASGSSFLIADMTVWRTPDASAPSSDTAPSA